MWVFFNDAFVSAVEHREDPELLMLRARKAGDLERLFPGFPVLETPQADYRFRVTLPREVFKALMVQRIDAIGYDNFKSSIPPDQESRHQAYMRVWQDMYAWQQVQAGRHREVAEYQEEAD